MGFRSASLLRAKKSFSASFTLMAPCWGTTPREEVHAHILKLAEGSSGSMRGTFSFKGIVLFDDGLSFARQCEHNDAWFMQ